MARARRFRLGTVKNGTVGHSLPAVPTSAESRELSTDSGASWRGTVRASAESMSTLPPPSLSIVPSLPVPGAARCPSLPNDSSWTALLANTSWGLAGLSRRRVRVRQQAPRSGEGLRLVVQSYHEQDVVAGRPTPYARPLASAQRSVSSDQLRRGVQLDLVHFEASHGDVVVIAWTEEGDADLDYDGLEARPPRSAALAAVEPLHS